MYNKEAQLKYQRSKVRQYGIKVYKNTEPDILQKLESVDNVSGYIKDLIRKDIAREA